MGKFYMMCGISGCGKTTFSKKFAAENNLVYLGIDEFYEWYNGDECNRNNYFEIWIEFFQAIKRHSDLGDNVIVDINAPSLVDRGQMLDWFRGFGSYTLFSMITEDEIRKDRNINRRRTVPKEDIKRMKNKYIQPSIETEDNRWTNIYEIYNYQEKREKIDLKEYKQIK